MIIRKAENSLIKALAKAVVLDSWSSSSIFRRSTVLLFFIAPALLFNFALSLAVAAFTPPEEFGLFYLGLSVATVLTAPSAILAFYQARHIASLRDKYGVGHATQVASALFRRICDLGAIFSFVFLFLIAATSVFLDGKSWTVWCAVTGIIMTTLLIDTTRGLLKGLQYFIALGLVSLLWMAARFLFGVSFSWLADEAWAGLVGVLFAGALMILVGKYFTRHLEVVNKDVHIKLSNLEWRRLLIFGTGYFLVLLVAYLDVLIGAVVLDEVERGFYSTASILPKGGFTLTLPVLQVMFPTIIAHMSVLDKGAQASIAARSIAMTALLSGAVGVSIYFGATLFCSGPLNIGHCETETLKALAFSVPAISLLRGLVLFQLAHGKDRHPLILIAPIFFFVSYELIKAPGPDQLSSDFAIFSTATVAIYGMLCIGSKR